MTDKPLGALPPGVLIASHADAPLGSPLYWVMGPVEGVGPEVEVRSIASGRGYHWPADRVVTVDPRSFGNADHYHRLERIRTFVQGTERPRTPEAVDWAWAEIIRILNESENEE